MNNKVSSLIYFLKRYYKNTPYFGFVRGHDNLEEKQSELIESSNLYRSLYLCKYNETEIIKVYGLG